MRSAKLLLIAAAGCAAAHAIGILVADPIWRYAEVLAIALLLIYAVVSGLSSPRWVVPTALAALIVSAVQGLPADHRAGQLGWQVLHSGANGAEPWLGFKSAFTVSWAPLTAAVVLFAMLRPRGWRPRVVAATVVASLLIIGYALVRVIGTWLAVLPSQQPDASDTHSTVTVIAVGVAVLPPLMLGMAALALAAALAERSLGVASLGAALLAVIALPYMDWSVGAVPLPLYADRTALSTWGAFALCPSMPQPVPAIAAMLELTSYMLLVAGLVKLDNPSPNAPLKELS